MTVQVNCERGVSNQEWTRTMNRYNFYSALDCVKRIEQSTLPGRSCAKVGICIKHEHKGVV